MTAQRLEVTIAELGNRGDGIAYCADHRIYVPYALPGETVRVELGERRGGGRTAHLIDVINAEPDRTSPPCPHYGDCGGCNLQHMERTPYLAWKRDRVARALARVGLDDVSVHGCIATAPKSRRSARFRALCRRPGVVLGFNEARSQHILDLAHCEIVRPAIFELLAPLRRLLQRIMSPGERLEVQARETAGGLDLWLIRSGEPDLTIRQALVEFADREDLARVAYGVGTPEIIVRRRPAAIQFGAFTVEPPPQCFVQADSESEAAMTGIIRRWLDDSTQLLDLFAGCGTFSMPLAHDMKVHAVDSDAAALDALRHAANATSGLKPVSAETRNLFLRPVRADEMKEFDAAIFDPPRAGARRQAEALAASILERIVGVSCNPETFARDARILVDGGYRLKTVRPVDQFLWSPHVELVALFRR